MILYDIHTHDIPLESPEEEEAPSPQFRYILNVYPLGFEYAKDSIKDLWFSCGVHPWYSEDAIPQIKFLKEIANDTDIIAIGEAGYDKLKGSDLNTQRQIFEQQVTLSEQLGKPLIIHCVKAWEQLLATKRKFAPKQPWIIHGYRGNKKLTEQLLAHGFYFSIGEKQNIEGLSIIPIDRLFCETDESNLPIYEIYQIVADALNISIENLAFEVENNVRNIFPLLVKEELQENLIG